MLVDQHLDAFYGLSIPNAEAFMTEKIDGSDVMIASTSGDVVSSDGVRLSPSESTNADIRKAYSYLTSEETNGLSISELENQTEVSRFYFPLLVYIPCESHSCSVSSVNQWEYV